MMYRTKTYIAADWDHDKNAVDHIHKWNDSKYWSLSFSDAHELTSARDSSLNCSIKRSLKTRIDASKTFVLIVGEHTNTVTAGSCTWCNSYNSWTHACAKGYAVNYKSYIKYECAKAVEARIKIIVLYNSLAVDRSKCPEDIRYRGKHVAMIYKDHDGKLYWHYDSVKAAFEA